MNPEPYLECQWPIIIVYFLLVLYYFGLKKPIILGTWAFFVSPKPSTGLGFRVLVAQGQMQLALTLEKRASTTSSWPLGPQKP